MESIERGKHKITISQITLDKSSTFYYSYWLSASLFDYRVRDGIFATAQNVILGICRIISSRLELIIFVFVI